MNQARQKLKRTIHTITVNLLRASRIVATPLPPEHRGDHIELNYRQGAINLIRESLELLNIDVEELSLELAWGGGI